MSQVTRPYPQRSPSTDDRRYKYIRVAFSACSPYATRPWTIVSAIHPALFHVGAAGWLQVFGVPRDVWEAMSERIVSALVRAAGVISVGVMTTDGRVEREEL